MLGVAVGNGHGTFPPTPAMKRFADSLARQKGIKPPPGYKTSISICRKFLNEHARKKADGEAAGKHELKPVSPAQLLYAKKIAQGKGARHSRRGQGQFGCDVGVDRLQPKHEAPQARSQERLQGGGINCVSIAGAEEEVAETQSWRRCVSVDPRPTKLGSRDAAADSLWQQGGRS